MDETNILGFLPLTPARYRQTSAILFVCNLVRVFCLKNNGFVRNWIRGRYEPWRFEDGNFHGAGYASAGAAGITGTSGPPFKKVTVRFRKGTYGYTISGANASRSRL